ncbi:MAG: acyltransferase [Planctomycetia bacterium]|nr:acyltransferase [Planctomycetia bacterium]
MRRVPELDALRGLAALFVLLYHFKPQTFRGGWTAVDLFFVLSGYLITSIILRHGDSEHFFRSFYARRTLRIWPIYYLTLLTFVLVNSHLPHPYPEDGLLNYLTFTQNIQYYDPYFRGVAPHIGEPLYPMWSLALEEQFYLVWPVVVRFVGLKRMVPVALGLLALGVGARYGGVNLQILPTRCDGFALGGLLAALASDEARVARNAAKLRGAFAVLGAISFAGLGWILLRFPGGGSSAALPWLSILLANLFYFSVVGLVVTSAGSRPLAPLRWRVLGSVGLISYGLYLYHSVAFSVVDHYANARGVGGRWWVDAIKFALPFAAAALSWRLIERPILSLKDRFGYSRGRPGGVTPADALAATTEPRS